MKKRRIPRTLEIAAAFEGAKYGHVAGDIVTFRGNGDPLRDLKVTIDPVQDLHGYDAPWPAGGGKNLLPFTRDETSGTFAGNVSWVLNSDGSVTLNGTATSTGNLTINLNNPLRLPADNYIINGCPSGGSSFTTYRLVININSESRYAVDTGSGGSFEIAEGDYFSCYIRINSGTTINNATFYPMVRSSSYSDATYAPYSNICPITGWTGANVTVSPTTTAADGTTYPITWETEAGTVYGGTLDVLSGVLTVKMANIASYNGETLPGKWISDRDVYAAGTSPFTGAQVVYELATPITYQLTPQEVVTLAGTNNLWADCGPVDVEYVYDAGTEGGKLALLLRHRKELLIAMRKGAPAAELMLGRTAAPSPVISDPKAQQIKPLKPVAESEEEENERGTSD